MTGVNAEQTEAHEFERQRQDPGTGLSLRRTPGRSSFGKCAGCLFDSINCKLYFIVINWKRYSEVPSHATNRRRRSSPVLGADYRGSCARCRWHCAIDHRNEDRSMDPGTNLQGRWYDVTNRLGTPSALSTQRSRPDRNRSHAPRARFARGGNRPHYGDAPGLVRK